MDKKKIGLIAGKGKFPLLVVLKAKSQNINIVVAAVKKDASWFLRFFVKDLLWVGPGELDKCLRFLQDSGAHQVIMAGQVSQENLFDKNVPLDHVFRKIFDAISDRKADTIFAAIADILVKYNLELADSTILLKDFLAPKGTITRRAPTEMDLFDINFGCDIAKAMGALDVGQTVVIKDKAIVAIEAMEGTDQTILRGGQIAIEGAVVVKMSKPNQDFRFDVPVIGVRTIRNMARVNASCLAIESGKTIIIDREKCVKLANHHNISIVCV